MPFCSNSLESKLRVFMLITSQRIQRILCYNWYFKFRVGVLFPVKFWRERKMLKFILLTILVCCCVDAQFDSIYCPQMTPMSLFDTDRVIFILMRTSNCSTNTWLHFFLKFYFSTLRHSINSWVEFVSKEKEARTMIWYFLLSESELLTLILKWLNLQNECVKLTNFNCSVLLLVLRTFQFTGVWYGIQSVNSIPACTIFKINNGAEPFTYALTIETRLSTDDHKYRTKNAETLTVKDLDFLAKMDVTPLPRKFLDKSSL